MDKDEDSCYWGLIDNDAENGSWGFLPGLNDLKIDISSNSDILSAGDINPRFLESSFLYDKL